MPSPNTDPNKRNFGDGGPHRSALRTFGMPYAEDTPSVPQTQSDRYAPLIVHLGTKRCPRTGFPLFDSNRSRPKFTLSYSSERGCDIWQSTLPDTCDGF